MPDWSEHLRPRLARLALSATREADIVEELSQHLELRYDELRADGASDADARRIALAELKEPETLAEHLRPLQQARTPEPIVRGAASGSAAADVVQDVRYAARLIRRQPAFAAVAALTLALGLGSATAIFSLVDALVLRALPWPDAERLVVIWAGKATVGHTAPATPPANADIAAWRLHTESFAGIAAFSPRTADLRDGVEAERVGAAGVTAGLFETLGVTPILGRTMTAGEDRFGGPPVALIGHALWRRRFGGDPGIVGRGVSINGSAYTVIGVLPPDFDFPRGAEWPANYPFPGRTEIWLPLAMRAADDGSGWSNWASRDERSLVAIGRVRSGATLARAQAEMHAFAAREAAAHPGTHKGWDLTLVPLRDQMAGHSSTALAVLFAAAGLVLLIACVNVASLLLARGVGRQQETAVRAALGASRGRLVRQLLTECLLLGLAACGAGLLVAQACLKAFLWLNPLTWSRLDEASIDLPALAFAVGVALVTSVVFGLAPALQGVRGDLRASLHEAGRGGDGAVRERLRAWLVGGEVALAVVLLTAGGLMIRSFLAVQRVDPGFRAESVLVFEPGLSPARAAGRGEAPQGYDVLATRLMTVPGVRAAGAISYVPLGGGENIGSFVVDGDPPVARGQEPRAQRRIVTPGYFAAMGIPVRRGRGITAQDSAAQPRVVVINDTLARQFFAGRDPIGRPLTILGRPRTVVGVVADVRSRSLEREALSQVYLPYAQVPWGGMTIAVHAAGDPLALVPAVRREVRAFDPAATVANVRTMTQMVSKASSVRRFNMALLAFFGAAALALTMLGIYGVGSFLVSRRTREIGVRMALGAGRTQIVRLVLGQALRPVVVGAGAGLAISLVVARLLASQLYGVTASDPFTLASIVGLLGAASLLATWLPARRATRVAPLAALRCD